MEDLSQSCTIHRRRTQRRTEHPSDRQRDDPGHDRYRHRFVICLMLIMVTLLAAESFFTRKGSFSGAGTAIVWPSQAR